MNNIYISARAAVKHTINRLSLLALPKRIKDIPKYSLAACLIAGTSFATPATALEPVDFDAALRGLNFNPATLDGNGPDQGVGNGILDAHEMALVAAVLADPTLDLSASGGVSYRITLFGFKAATAAAEADFAPLANQWPTAATVGAGYSMLGTTSFASYSAMSASLGAPMKGKYGPALALGQYFSFEGDADGDGVSNLAEYNATIAKGLEAYLRAALDPTIRDGSDNAAHPAVAADKKIVGVVLYPGFEVLDVFGPIEMWAYVPEFKVITIAENAGPVSSAQQGIKAVADYSFEDAPKLDIIMIPGGNGTPVELENETFLNFIREADKTTELTTSVCTGSALLAKAGVLSGKKATSNKSFFSLASDQDTSVDWQYSARWVEDGKYITSSGVSSGIDMALAVVARYHGKGHTGHLARAVEYIWNDDPANDPFAIAPKD